MTPTHCPHCAKQIVAQSGTEQMLRLKDMVVREEAQRIVLTGYCFNLCCRRKIAVTIAKTKNEKENQ